MHGGYDSILRFVQTKRNHTGFSSKEDRFRATNDLWSMSAMFRSNTKTVRAVTNTGDKRMKFNWFKRKEEFTPEMVMEILRADKEILTTEKYYFGYEKGLPVMTADEDFLEFLQEESMGTEIELVEVTELFKIWMAENCQ